MKTSGTTRTKTRPIWRELGLVAATLVIMAGQGAHAQAPARPVAPAEHLRIAASGAGKPVTTDHVGTFNGVRVPYRAIVSETRLDTAEGTPAALLVTISYVAQQAAEAKQRPVLFAFNGGPGGSSAPLHLGALGPRVLTRLDSAAFADPAIGLADNLKSPLDVADLVFIDPVNTGFSKALPGADMAWFKSVDGDSEATARLIANWLRTNDRMGSPVFVIGESYGTMRAVALARDIPRIDSAVRLRGVILTGPAYTYGQGGKLPNPAATAARLPMMASMAWYHGRIDKTQSWEAAVDKARRFGRGEYVGALMEGYQVSPERFDRVVAQLPALIGIPETYFRQRKSLIVQDFNAALLASDGRVLDRNDGRETEAAGKPPSTDFDTPRAGFKAAMRRYASGELGVRAYDDYFVLTPKLVDVVKDWDFTTAGSGALDTVLSAEMAAQPCLRLGVLQGRYDTLTNMGTTEYTVSQTKLPLDRLTTGYFDGGHQLLPTDEAVAFIRAFVTKAEPVGATCGQ
jgi:carboxypeptidase C (cathepsin A)